MPRALILAALLLPACGRGPDAARRLAEIPARAEWELPLRGQAHVVYTEGGVPHVYAEDRRDLAMVWGFTIARDRFFMMDLSRRLALGTLSEVLGADALRSDMSSRAEGNRQISEATLALVQDHHPELLEQIDAYVLGVNAYIDAVAAGRLPAPSEYVVAAPLLGAAGPSELIAPFDRLSVVAGAATVLAMSGFDASDVQRGLSASRLDGWYDGADLAELRQAGLRPDFWDRVEPGYDVASAPDWVSLPYPQWRRGPTEGRAVAVPVAPAERILARRAHLDALRGRDAAAGFGSNAWAVHADGTVDGRALLAGDGHLGLTIPPLFYSIGLDTSALSGTDDLTFTGMAVPGLPVPGPGTNGHIAWSQIAFFGDLTDWYREEIQLDPQGKPTASRFAGDWRPLVAHSESAVVRDVPLLGSVGRTDDDVGRHGMADERHGRVLPRQGPGGAGELQGLVHQQPGSAVNGRHIAGHRHRIAPMAFVVEGQHAVPGTRQRQRPCLHQLPRPGKAMRHHHRRAIRAGQGVERRGRGADGKAADLQPKTCAFQLPDGEKGQREPQRRQDATQVGAQRRHARAASITRRISAMAGARPRKTASPIRKCPMFNSITSGLAATGPAVS